jgi:Ca2+-binding EF-hand superfamily protein
VLKRAFSMFDPSKSGKIEKEKVRTILNTLGHTFDDHDLDIMLKAEDVEGKAYARKLKYFFSFGIMFLLYKLQSFPSHR